MKAVGMSHTVQSSKEMKKKQKKQPTNKTNKQKSLFKEYYGNFAGQQWMARMLDLVL